jgi:hypothetical protein
MDGATAKVSKAAGPDPELAYLKYHRTSSEN